MFEARRAGLRLQIVLALSGLVVLAFVPLFFAVASLTHAAVRSARERAALSLARAIAVHVADALRSGDPAAPMRALQGHVGRDSIEAVCFFSAGETRTACAGRSEALGVRAASLASGPATASVSDAPGNALHVVYPLPGATLVARIGPDQDGMRTASLVPLVALYMLTFALALAVFSYIGLTRLIVRPIEFLVGAADRVASGARTWRVPRSGARELVDLGASVQAMAEKLIDEEGKLLLKVQELTETTTRLARTQAQLVRSERMASVGRLAAGVAHEIGNPISAIMGMQDLLLEGDLPPHDQRDFLRRMRRETERIHTVLRDLLDFARPEAPSVADGARIEGADVRAVVDDVAALAAPQKVFHCVNLEKDVEGAPRVALSSQRLTQVLLNLVLNAGAAVSRNAGGRGRVTVRVRAQDAKVRIDVEDDGPGVANQVRDRLFEPFVTTKDIGEGTGLGLAVCRGVVESAGGEVTFDPSYTGGARFTVSLPACPLPEGT